MITPPVAKVGQLVQLVSGITATGRGLLDVVAEGRVLRLGGLYLTLVHLAAPDDQVDQHAQPRMMMMKKHQRALPRPPSSRLRKMSEKTTINSQIHMKKRKIQRNVQNLVSRGYDEAMNDNIY